MSNMTNTSAKGSDRYFLEDQERWESLGFDWKSWNATVTKILRKQTVLSSSQTGMKPHATHSRGRLSSSNWMA